MSFEHDFSIFKDRFLLLTVLLTLLVSYQLSLLFLKSFLRESITSTMISLNSFLGACTELRLWAALLFVLTNFLFLTLLLFFELQQSCREEVPGSKPLVVPWPWSSLEVFEGVSWQGSFPQSWVCKEQRNKNGERYRGICAVLGLSVCLFALAFFL